MNQFSDMIIRAFCWTLLHSLWQALLLAMLTGLMMLLTRKSPSALRYNLLAAIYMVFLFAVGFTFYKEYQAAANLATLQTTSGSPIIQQIEKADLATDSPIIVNDAVKIALLRFSTYFNENAALIVTIWFIIFMAKCVQTLSGLIRIQRIRHYRTSPAAEQWQEIMQNLAKKLGIRKKIAMLESAIIRSPLVIGFLKPTILVPIGLLTNLSPSEVESILLHELAHILRRDYIFNLIQCFADTLFFFNPAALWISSLIRNERENCCDDIAIQESRNKKQFVQALVSFHQYHEKVSRYAMPFADRKKGLVSRVKRIVQNRNDDLNRAEKSILVFAMLLFGIVFMSITQGQTVPKKTADNTASAKAAAPGQQPVNQKAKSKQQSATKKTKAKTPTASLNGTNGKDEDFANQDELSPDALKDLGFDHLSVDDLLRLKDHGVSAGFIRGFYELGYKPLSLDKLVALKDYGLSASFIRGFNALGFKNIPLDQAIELKNHGVSVEFISGLQGLGHKKLTLEEATTLKDHGVSLNFMHSIQQLGYSAVSLETATYLKDHGVDAEFIKGFRSIGFTKVTLDKAIQLKDHGVNIAYIEAIRKKTGSDHSLDDYISLKNAGFN